MKSKCRRSEDPRSAVKRNKVKENIDKNEMCVLDCSTLCGTLDVDERVRDTKGRVTIGYVDALLLQALS